MSEEHVFSECCNAPCEIGGGFNGNMFNWWCSKCGKPCSIGRIGSSEDDIKQADKLLEK